MIILYFIVQLLVYVKKAFDKIIENDWNIINNANKTKLQLKQELYQEKVEPSTRIASLIGSNFTAAVYMNLMALLLSRKIKLNFSFFIWIRLCLFNVFIRNQ